jgi:hypothetical protein
MSATWGNPENTYSPRVLPPVTHLRHMRLEEAFIETGVPQLLETQLSTDAASQTIGQQVANPLVQIDTAPRWQSATWPRSRGLNDHERIDAVP